MFNILDEVKSSTSPSKSSNNSLSPSAEVFKSTKLEHTNALSTSSSLKYSQAAAANSFEPSSKKSDNKGKYTNEGKIKIFYLLILLLLLTF